MKFPEPLIDNHVLLSFLPQAGSVSCYRRMTNIRRISGKKHNNQAKKVKKFEQDLIILPGPKSTSVPRLGANLYKLYTSIS